MIGCKHLTIILIAAIVVAACSRTPSDGDIKHAVADFMAQKNGRSVDPAEPYVNVDRLCAQQLSGARGEFQGVGDVVANVGLKRSMTQGLSHWYAKDIWPVKVELRLACHQGDTKQSVTAAQEFEFAYDSDAGRWEVDSSSWGPWPDKPTENDVIWWQLLAALAASILVGTLAAATSGANSQPGPFASGWIAGLGAGAFAGIAAGVYIGFAYQIINDDGGPGLMNALAYGFIGLFVGALGGAIGGCAGGLAGRMIGRLNSAR